MGYQWPTLGQCLAACGDGGEWQNLRSRGQTKAGKYLEYFTLAGNRLCSNVALAFASSASFHKGLTVAEGDTENFKTAKNLNERDYGRVRNATFGAQALNA